MSEFQCVKISVTCCGDPSFWDDWPMLTHLTWWFPFARWNYESVLRSDHQHELPSWSVLWTFDSPPSNLDWTSHNMSQDMEVTRYEKQCLIRVVVLKEKKVSYWPCMSQSNSTTLFLWRTESRKAEISLQEPWYAPLSSSIFFVYSVYSSSSFPG